MLELNKLYHETKLCELLTLLHNKGLEKTVKVRINGELFNITGVADGTKDGLVIEAEKTLEVENE